MYEHDHRLVGGAYRAIGPVLSTVAGKYACQPFRRAVIGRHGQQIILGAGHANPQPDPVPICRDRSIVFQGHPAARPRHSGW